MRCAGVLRSGGDLVTTTETTQAERPTRLVGVLMPAAMAAQLKDLAWMKRTTVSAIVRAATAATLEAQKESAQ